MVNMMFVVLVYMYVFVILFFIGAVQNFFSPDQGLSTSSLNILLVNTQILPGFLSEDKDMHAKLLGLKNCLSCMSVSVNDIVCLCFPVMNC